MAQAFPFTATFAARIARARDEATATLLNARGSHGGWTGELSSSALSTATAITALSFVPEFAPGRKTTTTASIQRGSQWLVSHQNSDGGWGDTVKSRSNISTTMLVWAALARCGTAVAGASQAFSAAENWLIRVAGSAEPEHLVAAVEQRYGSDRTFSIPILTMCALCGRLGAGEAGWRHVRPLPFELAVLPQRWFGALQLPVVSYALPALIAIGQVRHGLGPPVSPPLQRLRTACRQRTLAKLRQLQPPGGGFLEATPLTSFVTMSLAALGLHDDPVVRQGTAFIIASIREDGSWPIDTNLATWVTTLALNALLPDEAPSAGSSLDRGRVQHWLLQQQFQRIHPYTLAAPGGWAWTDLPGGVPDADDTPGAVLALHRLAPKDKTTTAAIAAGVRWLLDLQNRDGGIPTFCRGWGRLPFDRSSPDLTAHTLRAWLATRNRVSPQTTGRIRKATAYALSYLLRTQRDDGSWVPLWFGHQEHPADENPLYGTARVLPALCDLREAGELRPRDRLRLEVALARARDWLACRQNADGGWSGAANASSSVEETALALEALTAVWPQTNLSLSDRADLQRALVAGGNWLCTAVEAGHWQRASPIGFYFAKLWYFERLYPLIFTVGALQRLARLT